MTRRAPAGRGRTVVGVCAAVLLLSAWAQPAAAQVSVRGFVQAGLLRFAADRSLAAVAGSAAGAAWGAGAQVGVARLFVQASVERYAAAGRRVFVFEERVFDLGLPNRIAITPIQVTAGYRAGSRVAAYGGGGLGAYRFRETAPFGRPEDDGTERAPGSPAGDEVRATHRSFHVLAGVETPLLPWLRVGGEGQWTWVPDALGGAGASAAFEETDLGGFVLRVKLLVGY